jgi:hypothetical protein
MLSFPLGKTYLDFRFSASKHADVRILERPARWMSESELKLLVEEMRALVGRSIPGESLDYGVLTGDTGRLDAAIITLIRDKASRHLIAFNALSVMSCDLHGQPVDVIHLGLVIVEPGARAQGLSWVLYGLTTMLLFARRQMRPLWISNVTQVPAIFGMVSEAFTNVYPSPMPGSRRSFEHVCLAREIMSRHRHVFGVGPDAGWDEARFVITNSYTGGSDNLKKPFEAATHHRKEIFNEVCKRELDYGRGDDFLQLGQVTTQVARDYFMKSVPRDSLGGLAVQFAFLVAQSLLLPVWHWFTPGRAFGDLRPWKTS